MTTRSSLSTFAVLVLASTLAWAAPAKRPPAGKPADKPAAQTPAKPAAKPAPPKPYTVRRAAFRQTIETQGKLDPADATELRIRLKAWSPKAGMKVLFAAEQGATVKKGTVLLTLESEDLEKAIEEAELAAKSAKLALDVARAGYEAGQKLAALDLAAAERARKQADEDLQRYLKVDRPLALRQVQAGLDTAADRLFYLKEELRQLEKMYKADDLTEDTEEVILRRMRDSVKRSEFALEVQKIEAERKRKVTIPRKDIAIKEAAQRQAVAWAKTQRTARAAREKARIELTKVERAFAQAKEKLADLQADMGALTARSPADGIVYYGPSAKGTWPKATRELEKGAKIMPGEVVLTVVAPGRMKIAADVPEKDWQSLKPGLACRIQAEALGKRTLAGRVTKITPVPVGGKIPIVIEVAPAKGVEAKPGMSAKVTIVVAEKPGALAVPSAMVYPDPGDKAKKCVYVRAGRRVQARTVTAGRSSGGKTEITAGLREGETIVAKPSKGEK